MKKSFILNVARFYSFSSTQLRLKFCILMLFFIFFTDCASYWNNRRRDLQDVFTVGIEKPVYGFNIKLAPLNIGFLFVGGDSEPGKKDLGQGFGLRGGSFSSYFSQQLVFGLLGGETFYSGELELAEDGSVQFENKIPLIKNPRDNIKSYSLKYVSIISDKPKERQKQQKEKARKEIIETVLAENPNPDPALLAYLPKEVAKPHGYPKSYLYQFELTLGVYRGIRIGLNPAEFLDFVLGFTTYDLYDDDLKD